jgi:hypothetical protein
MSTVWTAPASLAAIWKDTDLRAARSAGLWLEMGGVKT